MTSPMVTRSAAANAASEDAPAVTETPRASNSASNGTETTPSRRRRGRPRKKRVPAEPEAPPDLQSTTVRDILAGMKRRSGGIPMPSSVARNQERRKRRRAGVDPDAMSEPVSVAPSAPQSGIPSESDRTDTVVAPQVTIDEDGNIVVDQESLVVNAGVAVNAERESGQVTTIENLAVGAQVTSASYAKRETPIKWEATETEKFYNALRLFGTDFSLMERIFPGRTRRQLKLKFKREERKNSDLIDSAMKNRKPGGAALLAEFALAAKQVQKAAAEKEGKTDERTDEVVVGISGADSERNDATAASATAADGHTEEIVGGIVDEDVEENDPIVKTGAVAGGRTEEIVGGVSDEDVEEEEAAVVRKEAGDGHTEEILSGVADGT